jgi:hypothetical protein
MLCETHKDMLFKGGSRVLALGGVVLLATGAALVHRPGLQAPLSVAKPLAHGAVGTALTSVAPGERASAQPAVRRVSAAHARATISLYEHTIRRSTLLEQGCDAAKRGVGGIVILDFGQPAYNGHTYGTNLFSGAFAGNTTITEAMLSYAVGYRNCLAKGSTLSISLARGTSNYHPAVPNPYQAGRRWAREVQTLQAEIEQRGIATHVTSAAADDVEPSWDRTFHRTRDFFRGYRDAANGYVLYNFGSLDGGVGSVWTAQQIFFVASGMKYVAAIPEIYNGAMADEWAELNHIAKQRYHRTVKFAGVMTQHTSANHAIKPRTAHKLLSRALATTGGGGADVPATLTNIRSAE